METIKLKGNECIPRNYTGIAEYESGIKYWYKDGNFHRIDGPACEYRNRDKYWYIDDFMYHPFTLNQLIENTLFLKIEKGKYDLDWLKFLTERGIQEFPIIPGMRDDEEFKVIFEKLGA